MSIAISGSHDVPDPRTEAAVNSPIRRWWQEQGGDPLDARLECPLGRLRLGGFLSEDEYQAGCRWRNIYANWLKAIDAPPDLSDEAAEAFERSYKFGAAALLKLGRNVFDSVNALVVYEEPEELGGFWFTARAARVGLRLLSEIF